MFHLIPILLALQAPAASPAAPATQPYPYALPQYPYAQYPPPGYPASQYPQPYPQPQNQQPQQYPEMGNWNPASVMEMVLVLASIISSIAAAMRSAKAGNLAESANVRGAAAQAAASGLAEAVKVVHDRVQLHGASISNVLSALPSIVGGMEQGQSGPPSHHPASTAACPNPYGGALPTMATTMHMAEAGPQIDRLNAEALRRVDVLLERVGELTNTSTPIMRQPPTADDTLSGHPMVDPISKVKLPDLPAAIPVPVLVPVPVPPVPQPVPPASPKKPGKNPYA